VLVAYTLIEALLRRQHAEEWTRVRDALHRAIANRVQSIAFNYYLVASKPQSWLNAKTHHDVATSLDDMATYLFGLRAELANRQDDEWATSRQLYREALPDIEFIRGTLAARLFDLTDEPALAEALVALDEAALQWREGIQLIHEDWGYPNELAWEHACGTLKALTALYREVTQTPVDTR
jgi:hypothetical protein